MSKEYRFGEERIGAGKPAEHLFLSFREIFRTAVANGLAKEEEAFYAGAEENSGSGTSEMLLRHLKGECADVKLPEWEEVTFNTAEALPQLLFSASQASAAPYSFSPEEMPTAELSIPATAEELTAFHQLTQGNGHKADPAALQRFMQKARSEALGVLKAFSDTASAQGLLTDCFNLLYAWVTEDGRAIFPSAPIPFTLNDTPWALELGEGKFEESQFRARCRILRSPLLLQYRLRSAGVSLALFTEMKICGAAIYISSGPTAPLPENENLTFTHTTSSTPFATASGIPAFIFSDTEQARRLERMSRPDDFRQVAFIPVSSLLADNTGPKGIPFTGPLKELLFGTAPKGMIPDRSTLLPYKGYKVLTYGGMTHSLRMKALFPSIIPPRISNPHQADNDSEMTTPGSILIIRREGSLLRQLSAEAGIPSEGVSPSEGAGQDEADRELLSIISGKGPLYRLYHPLSEVEYIVAQTGDSFHIFPMTSMPEGGSGWYSASGSLPAPVDSLPALLSGLPESAKETDMPQYIAAADEDYPFLLPSSRLVRIDSREVAGLTSFSGNRASIAFPLTAFTSEGVKLMGRSQTNLLLPPSVKELLTNLEIVRKLPDGTSLAPERRARLCCATRHGSAFLTESGMMMATLSGVKRLSKRGSLFPEGNQLLYHNEYDLLELRDAAGHVLWVYDLEENKELAFSDSYDTTGSYDSSGARHVSTPPFELPDRFAGRRLLLVEAVTDRGIGTPPADLSGMTGMELKLFGSADRWQWHPLGSVEGLSLPDPCSTYRWLRAALTLPAAAGRPLGLALTIR